MNRLKEWFFIGLKMDKGRPINQDDVMEFFNEHCNEEGVLIVKVEIGSMGVLEYWDAKTLIDGFKQHQLLNKIKS